MRIGEVIEEGARADMMITKILQMAEAAAYDEGAERGNVTSDDVYAAAQRILADIERGIGQRLQADIEGANIPNSL